MNIRWSFRKLRTYKHRRGLILDIGSGGNPNPFADVLLEKFADTTDHRYHKAVFDRPTVLGDAENMPFKDNAFTYSVAFHVLEHVSNPEAMLNELSRTSNSGYIETPNSLHERLFPYHEHLWEIYNDKDTVYITPKQADCLYSLPKTHLNNQFAKARRHNPELFHMQMEWSESIAYKIHPSNDTSAQQPDPNSDCLTKSIRRNKSQRFINSLLLKCIQNLRRSKKIDLTNILQCTQCKGNIEETADRFICKNAKCKAEFSKTPYPDFNSPL